jgi:hypothetical protein
MRVLVVTFRISDLIGFANRALEAFDRYITEQNVKPSVTVSTRYYTTELEISETGSRFSGSSEQIQEPQYGLVIHDFLRNQIMETAETTQLVKSMVSTYGTNIDQLARGANQISQSKFWLQNFAAKVIDDKIHGKLSTESVVEYASLFMSELQLLPLEYKQIHHLNGLFLENDSLRIGDAALIRQVKREDLEYTVPLGMPDLRMQPMRLPSSVLEVNMTARDEVECHEYVQRILDAVRMYRVGSVYPIESRSWKRTMIWPAAESRSTTLAHYPGLMAYTVRKQVKESFVKFIDTMEKKLGFDPKEKSYRSLTVALGRYRSALVERTDRETALMTAVMGLESLLTFRKDRGENAFKLGLRVARLLGHAGFKADDVRSLVVESYELRNKIVHGSYLQENETRRVGELLPQTLNFLRISLVSFVLNLEMGTDRFLRLIDSSLADESENASLGEILGRNVREYPDVFR